MKTKLSKRILSILLAALMVVTSIPLMAFAATIDADVDAVDPAVQEVLDAMEKYEQKMDGTIYKNISAAYNAYVDAQKALDAYIYGGDKNVIAGKAKALADAADSLADFVAYKGTGTAKIGQSVIPEDVYSNLLYANGSTDTDYSTGVEAGKVSGALKYGCFGYIYYPETVLLYDGTVPSMPIISGYANTNNRYKTQPRAMYTTTGNLELKDYWNGYTDGFVWSNASDYTIGYSANTWTGSMTCDNKSTKRSYRNVMYYNGTPTNTLTTIDSTNWTFAQDHNSATADMTLNTKIHIVNYKKLVDALFKNSTKLVVNYSDYREGGYADVIAAFDAATSLDPNSFFKSGNGVNELVKAIDDAVAGLNAASVKDSDDYQLLRNAMPVGVRNTFAAGNTNYTEESWTAFENAYIAAQNTMKAVMTSGYTATNCAKLASDLTTAYGQLRPKVPKVDTSALTAVIDKFEAYKNIFTADSYKAAEDVITAAKVAVWGSANQYNVPALAPDDSAEAKALVAEQLAAVEAAVRGLRLSMDVVVEISGGNKYSINSALALVESLDASDYSNYTTLIQPAIKNADAYIIKAEATDFTDLDTQVAEYTSVVQALYDAYNGRLYSITAIPDGTVFKNNGTNAIAELSKYDIHAMNLGFSYTSSAVVFKTKHEETRAKYGNAQISFGVGTSSGSGSLALDNNMLDSISINATAAPIDGTSWINGYASGSSSLKALTDEQKTTYAGCLSYTASNGTISLDNLRYGGRTANNNNPYYAILQDGTQIKDEATAKTVDLTSSLGTTDGTSNWPSTGGVFARTNKNDDIAYTYVDADMMITLPSTEKKTLTAGTVPTSYTVRLDTYFGGVLLRNVQNFTSTFGYTWYTSQENSEKLNSAVTVVDISYLIDLINLCNGVTKDHYKYTEESYDKFAVRLAEAQENIDYQKPSLTTTQLLNQCKTKYTNLWAAYKGLVERTVPVQFSYKAADGTDTVSTIDVAYGSSLNSYLDQLNAIKPGKYVSEDGSLEYTWNGTWSPAVDLSAAITPKHYNPIVYTANYDSKLNKADFTAYNNAVASLLGALTDKTFSVSTLNALNEEIASMTYFDMPEADRAALMGDAQASINAETAKLIALKDGLTPAEIKDNSVADAIEQAKFGKDVDVYDMSGLDFEYTQTMRVAGKSVVALTVGTQAELDKAIEAVLNNLTKSVYKIYLNDVEIGTAEYGTSIVVDSMGNVTMNASEAEAGADAKMSDWSYSYVAPSRDNIRTQVKYMCTAKTINIIVKGDTYLDAVAADNADAGYIVKFTTNTGKIFDVEYTTTGSVEIPKAPDYAFYRFAGYQDGYKAGDTVNVTSNMTIVANYEVKTSDKYQIDFYDGYASWYDLAAVSSDFYNYNQRADFSSSNAYCWTLATYDESEDLFEYTLLSYGSDYSFYACQVLGNEDQTVGLVALSEDDYKKILDGRIDQGKSGTSKFYDGRGVQIKADKDEFTLETVYPTPQASVSVLEKVVPVYDENNKFTKFSMIGSFAVPEGYTVAEAGFLFTSNQAADMTVENVGLDGIARMKSYEYTCGDQFVVNVTAPTIGAFKYVGYIIIKDSKGNISTLYSRPVLGNTNDISANA